MTEKQSESITKPLGYLPQILDPCCGGRMFYYEKRDPRVLYSDIRYEEHVLCDGRVFTVSPDSIADFRGLPHPDDSFHLVVFDPPHLERCGPRSWQRKKYGKLTKGTWREDLAAGFSECWRVLKPGGTLFSNGLKRKSACTKSWRAFRNARFLGTRPRRISKRIGWYFTRLRLKNGTSAGGPPCMLIFLPRPC